MANTISRTISDDILSAIIQIESAGRPDAKAGTSSATGLFQFTNGTWVDTVKKHRPDLMQGRSADQLLALRKNAKLAIELGAKLTEDNAITLGPGWKAGDLYLAHFLGVGMARKFLRADPNMLAAELAGPKATAANESILGRGKTVGDVRQWAARKMAAARGHDWIGHFSGAAAPTAPAPKPAPPPPEVAPEPRQRDHGDETAEEDEPADDAPVDPLEPEHIDLDDAVHGPMSGKKHPVAEAVQTALNGMNYHVGEPDGKWGGRTKGAVSAYKLDRGLAGRSVIDKQLLNDIAKAQDEGFTRPIAKERAEAKPEELEKKLPEVAASGTAERTSRWGAIGAAITAAITGVQSFFGDAIGYITPVKEFAMDLPGWVWAVAAVGIAFGLYYISRKAGSAKLAATQAYREGARV